MPTIKFTGKAAQVVFDALANPPRKAVLEDIYPQCEACDGSCLDEIRQAFDANAVPQKGDEG